MTTTINIRVSDQLNRLVYDLHDDSGESPGGRSYLRLISDAKPDSPMSPVNVDPVPDSGLTFLS